MTDAEFIFKQTEIERKKNGYGDRHKKRQGGKTVRFPSDYLTKKERQAMCGEVITYKEKPFYTREEFLALPEDLRLKWVNSIINRYCVGHTAIARIVFGQKDFIATHADLQYVNKGPKGQAAVKGNRKLEADYAAFLEATRTPVEAQEAEEVKVIPEEAETPAEAVLEAKNDEITQEESKQAGFDSIVALVTALQSLKGTGAKLTIEVTL